VPINYHELVGDRQEHVRALERKLDYLPDGVLKVLEDAESHGGERRGKGFARWDQVRTKKMSTRIP